MSFSKFMEKLEVFLDARDEYKKTNNTKHPLAPKFHEQYVIAKIELDDSLDELIGQRTEAYSRI